MGSNLDPLWPLCAVWAACLGVVLAESAPDLFFSPRCLATFLPTWPGTGFVQTSSPPEAVGAGNLSEASFAQCAREQLFMDQLPGDFCADIDFDKSGCCDKAVGAGNFSEACLALSVPKLFFQHPLLDYFWADVARHRF